MAQALEDIDRGSPAEGQGGPLSRFRKGARSRDRRPAKKRERLRTLVRALAVPFKAVFSRARKVLPRRGSRAGKLEVYRLDEEEALVPRDVPSRDMAETDLQALIENLAQIPKMHSTTVALVPPESVFV